MIKGSHEQVRQRRRRYSPDFRHVIEADQKMREAKKEQRKSTLSAKPSNSSKSRS